MRFAISSGSCFPVNMKKAWELFMPDKLLENYYSIANDIKINSAIDNLSLSYHPSRVMSSKIFIQMVLKNQLKVTSIDTPDVVRFFDQRMMSEFGRKQSFSDLIIRMKNHAGWRLMNVPDFYSLFKKIECMDIHNGTLLKISSHIADNLNMLPVFLWLNRSNYSKIAIELDSFNTLTLASYFDTVKKVEELSGKKTGICLDPAHLIQGQAMGKWGDPMSLLDEIKKAGFNVYSLDFDPVEILDQKMFNSGIVDCNEEVMDEVIKIHCHPKKNIFDYPKYFQKVLDLFGSTLEEVTIELNPMDLANPGEKFFEDIKKMAEMCHDFERR